MIWPTPARHERRTRLDNIAIALTIIAALLIMADCVWGHDVARLFGVK